MIIGIPKEIKNNENRVALTPGAASQLLSAGHQILIETNAGFGSGFTDDDYVSVGAEILDQAKDVWASSDMIMKVKEPLPEEYSFSEKDSSYLRTCILRQSPPWLKL